MSDRAKESSRSCAPCARRSRRGRLHRGRGDGPAAQKVDKLLAQYASAATSSTAESFEEAAYAKADFKRDKRFKHKALWFVLHGIAELCECKCWFPREEGGIGGLVARFYGEEQDVEMAIYLCKVIEGAIESEWFIYSFANPTADLRSFTDGCAMRIHERLRELRLHTEQFVRARGKALVVQTKAMVRARKLAEMGLKFKNSRLKPNDGRDYWSGHAAGNNVTFHQGVRHDGRARPSHAAVPLVSVTAERPGCIETRIKRNRCHEPHHLRRGQGPGARALATDHPLLRLPAALRPALRERVRARSDQCRAALHGCRRPRRQPVRHLRGQAMKLHNLSLHRAADRADQWTDLFGENSATLRRIAHQLLTTNSAGWTEAEIYDHRTALVWRGRSCRDRQSVEWWRNPEHAQENADADRA